MTTESGLGRSSTLKLVLGTLFVVGAIGAVVWFVSRPEELATLHGHAGPVRAVAASADGALIASCGDDGTIRIWGAASHRQQNEITPGGKVRAVAFGPESLLASTGDDAVVHLWNVESGSEVKSLSGAKKALECVAISPDGSLAAAAGIEGTVYLWKLKDPAAPRSLAGHAKHVHAITFTPDSRTLISGGEDGSLRFWDASTGASVAAIAPDKRHLYNLVVSPDGRTLYGSASGKGVKRWSLPDRREMPNLEAGGMVRGVAVSADGRTLATVHEDGRVQSWDAESAAALESYTGHKRAGLAVAFLPDGTFATAGGDNTLKRWRARR